ncbi:MAG: CoA transferase, partial [Myxococcales bacterium]|nr:CoA transferase [Myxococcales bacterium]
MADSRNAKRPVLDSSSRANGHAVSVTAAGTLGRLRVIDLSTEIAGPYCTKLLSDAGADVIKVESPGAGDPLRRWKASPAELPEGSDGALFQYLNASKRSIALDVQDAGDRETLLQLAATADLWIDNPSSGAQYERGITWNILREVNASLSFVSITPWGTTGPWADRPWTEFTLQAAIGS